jgi:hypothetical protein
MADPQSGALQPYEILRRQRAAQQRVADEEEEARERLANRPRRKVRMPLPDNEWLHVHMRGLLAGRHSGEGGVLHVDAFAHNKSGIAFQDKSRLLETVVDHKRTPAGSRGCHQSNTKNVQCRASPDSNTKCILVAVPQPSRQQTVDSSAECAVICAIKLSFDQPSRNNCLGC